MFIHPFFHLSVCFFVPHAIVRAYRVHVFKEEKTPHAGPVEDKTALCHMLVLICFLGRRPLFHVSLFLL